MFLGGPRPQNQRKSSLPGTSCACGTPIAELSVPPVGVTPTHPTTDGRDGKCGSMSRFVKFGGVLAGYAAAAYAAIHWFAASCVN